VNKDALIEAIRTLDKWSLGVLICLAIGSVGAAFVGFLLWRANDQLREIQSSENLAQQVEIAKLHRDTEKLAQANLAMESAVSPRVLEQGLTAIELKPFADISVAVVSPSDFEPKRTAGQIRYMLDAAGWKRIAEPEGGFLAFNAGVVVHATAGAQSGPGIAAANALITVLKDNNIAARLGYPIQELGPSAILVEVGPKPLPLSLQIDPANVPADSRGNKVWGNITE
jgi:hypothetical protein